MKKCVAAFPLRHTQLRRHQQTFSIFRVKRSAPHAQHPHARGLEGSDAVRCLRAIAVRGIPRKY